MAFRPDWWLPIFSI